MKKLTLTFIISAAMSLATAGELLIPYKPGGATATILQPITAALIAEGVTLTPKYLNTCNMVSAAVQQLEPSIFYWSSDMPCPAPIVSNQTLIALTYWTPIYLCGKAATLEHYKTSNVPTRIGVGEQPLFVNLGSAIARAVNSNIKVVGYTNSGAIKTALAVGEIDLILYSSGAALEKDKLVTCYAASTAAKLGNLSTLVNITGPVPGSVTSLTYFIATKNMDPLAVAKAQLIVQGVLRKQEYTDLVVSQSRQLSDVTVDMQVRRINQSLTQ